MPTIYCNDATRHIEIFGDGLAPERGHEGHRVTPFRPAPYRIPAITFIAQSDMIPCYVSGKGMHATATTWAFKTAVIEAMESSGLGFDTRCRYYAEQFPEMDRSALARMICDPIEYYDKDWPAYYAARKDRMDEEQAATEFMLERDREFRNQARVAIYCYDEAGFGSGVNTMRFIHAGKPVLGFYNAEQKVGTLNLSNILQLEIDYPELVILHAYKRLEEVPPRVTQWLGTLQP